ncbi:hypothetical protein GCM10009818_08540 [Nakamurella flavida]
MAPAGVAVGLILLTACSAPTTTAAPAPTSAASEAPTTLTASGVAPSVTNDLAEGSAHHDLSVAGEPFALTVDYWTTGDPSAWSSLAAKDMNLSLHLVPVAGTTTPDVALSRSSVVTSLRSTNPGLDGLVTSTTVDQAPAALPGYSMSVNFPYDQVAPVRGFGPDLIGRWTLLAGEQPLTDEALGTAGVYANQIDYTYDLVIKNAGDAGYHKRTVTDSLTVPVPAPAPPATETSAATTDGTAAPATG